MIDDHAPGQRALILETGTIGVGMPDWLPVAPISRLVESLRAGMEVPPKSIRFLAAAKFFLPADFRPRGGRDDFNCAMSPQLRAQFGVRQLKPRV